MVQNPRITFQSVSFQCFLTQLLQMRGTRTEYWIRWSLLGLLAASGVCMEPTFREQSRLSSGIWYPEKTSSNLVAAKAQENKANTDFQSVFTDPTYKGILV